MSLINLNRNDISTNMQDKIASSIGITNFSQTSKVKLLTDIFSEEISNLAEVQNNSVLNMYSDTATGESLDVKGSQYGVYRKIKDSIYITKEEVTAFIRPKIDGEVFGDTIRQTIVLQRGEKIRIGTSYNIILSENVSIQPASSTAPVAGTIVSSENTGLEINEGDTFKIETTSRLSDNLNTVLLEFSSPISIDGGLESDDSFRRRVILARDGNNIATPSSVIQTIVTLPDLLGYVFMEGKRGSGSLDIGVMTETLQRDSTDGDMESTIQLLKTDLKDVAPMGSDILIYSPSKLTLIVDYVSNGDDTSDENIKTSILEAFFNVYEYNNQNELLVRDLEREVYSLIPSANVNISSLSLYDETIRANVASSGERISAAPDYFMFLDIASINREI